MVMVSTDLIDLTDLNFSEIMLMDVDLADLMVGIDLTDPILSEMVLRKC